MFFKRFLCSHTAARRHHQHGKQWSVKQVTNSNFSEALQEIKDCIFNSDFVAVSLQKTGGHSATWQRILPIDTAETAYMKVKDAATRFQILQFSVCPFSVKGSKLIAHPFNFHVFPRDELKVGMPSYSFSCQSSYLSSMAREGFDFNACIYNGISYLSKAQESAAKIQTGNLSPVSGTVEPSSVYSVADTIFMERIESRVKNWIRACKDSNKTEVADALISSLRKLVAGSEVFGSRPSLTIDVCSERQVPLVIEALKEFVDVVPLHVTAKGVGVQAVRAVLTSSKEDKTLLEKEIQDTEHQQRKLVRGFREVIDLISTSQRPVVVHNSLYDLAFIHSKFQAPLPSTMDEFKNSLLSLFPHTLDVNHLMKEIGPFDKMNNVQAALSYLERRFSAPIDMDISNQAEETENTNTHGHNVLRVCQLFVKLCSILKIPLEFPEGERITQLAPSLQRTSNTFSSKVHTADDDGVGIRSGNSEKVRTDNLVFLWGLKNRKSSRNLKNLICDSYNVLSEEFDVRMLDRTCAVVVFWNAGVLDRFLGLVEGSGGEGLRCARYNTYRRVCESGLWKADLAECFDEALDESEALSRTEAKLEESVIYWNDDEMINLDDL
ncbi:hypothetical protein ABFS83_14G058900 [Erythranthe nasuta]